jgi:hypothetical protein
MKKPATKSIQILKPGTFTDVNGVKVTFSASDVEEVVASYDAASDPAPAVIGHPKTDDPAYAWAESLSMQNGIAVADVGQLDPGFESIVNAGRYKTISPSIYPRNHPANPTPGKYYLKHIGFLGAAKPAIKGLASVAFSEAQNADCITFEINLSEQELDPNQEQEMPNPNDPETADELKAVKLKAEKLKADAIALSEREEAMTAREKQIADREAELEQADRAANEASAMSFAESLVEKMILPPAHKDRVAFLLTNLATQPDEALCFGEGDKAERPDAALKALLNAAKPVLNFGELAKPEDAPEVDNQDASDIATRALQFAEEQSKAGTPVSAAVAVRKVMKDAGAK